MAGAGERGGAGRGPAGGAPGAAALLALLLGGAALAWALRAAGGGPRAPDAAHLRAVLSGTELAASDLAAGASALAWAVLGYLALSVGLRLALLAAGRLSGGARWARAGLRLSTLVTVPAVRRLVDGGVGGTLLAASWLPLAAPPGGAPDAAYAAAAPAPEAHAAWAGARPAPGAPAPEALPAALYTVAPGDDLWEIARRVHADGSRWVEIASANPGLQAPGEGGGEPLRPGRVLRVPLGDRGARPAEGVTSYRVRRGDHLWGIAERFLGDGFRWVEIWERNRGREMADGSRLTDPDRLRPGWVLELPLRLAPGAAPPEEAAAGAAAEGAAEPGPSVPEAGPAGAGGREWPRAAAPALLAAAGVAGAGGAAVVVRRLARHGRLPRRGRGGEDERPGDAAHVSLACRYLAGALADAGFGETRPLLVEESAERINVTARTPVGDAPELGSRGPELERRLGCPLAVEPAGPARVRITLRGFSPRHALFAGEPPGPRHAPIVPVGSRREGIAYLNLGAVGLVTVRGEAAGRRALLRSWLETLASTHAPDELAIRLDRETAEELGTDAADAHAGGARPPDAADLARELSELLAVRAGGGGSERPLAAFLTPGEGGDELVSELREAGPARGVSVVRSLPAGGDEGEGEPGTATVHAGGDGAIEIRLGRDAPIHLDAVTVRRGEPAPSSGGGPREAGGGALAGSEEGDPGAALRPPGRDAGGEAPATGRGGAGETGGAAAGGQDDPAGGPGGGGGAGGQDDPAGGPGGGAGGQDDPPGGPGGGAGGQDDPPGGPGGGAGPRTTPRAPAAGAGRAGRTTPRAAPAAGAGRAGRTTPRAAPAAGAGRAGRTTPLETPTAGAGRAGRTTPRAAPAAGRAARARPRATPRPAGSTAPSSVSSAWGRSGSGCAAAPWRAGGSSGPARCWPCSPSRGERRSPATAWPTPSGPTAAGIAPASTTSRTSSRSCGASSGMPQPATRSYSL